MEKAEEEANSGMKGANKKAGGYGKARCISSIPRRPAAGACAVHMAPAQVTQAEIARRQAAAVLLDHKRSSGSQQPKQCRDYKTGTDTCFFSWHSRLAFMATDRP